MNKYARPYFIWLNPLFALVVWLRTKLYEWGIFNRKKFDVPVLVVGNLSTGGTGKTPMVDFIIQYIKSKKKIAALSRGYGRKTKGFRAVLTNDKPTMVGDEPLLLKQKHPDISVFVCENRVEGIEQIMKAQPEIEGFVLDDAYQHLRLQAAYYVLLTDFSNIYIDDALLPAGNLRESAIAANRADAIVITKCPLDISDELKKTVISRIKPLAHQPVFFSWIDYAPLPGVFMQQPFVLVTGIANPQALLRFLGDKDLHFTHLPFDDHHTFTAEDYDRMASEAKKQKTHLILTTEKDSVRMDLKKIQKLGLEMKTVNIHLEVSDKQKFLALLDSVFVV